MDETTTTILLGCKLAKDLEANLHNLTNQPQLLSKACDEIISVFSNVKERVSYSQMAVAGELHDEPQEMEINASGVQEWLRSSRTTQAMDLPRAQVLLGAKGAFGDEHAAKMKEIEPEHAGLEEMVREMGGREAEGSTRLRDRGGRTFGRGASVLRQRKRRDHDGETRTMTVPAPRMGNTEIPPEDGYTWRKYGQKDILNSKFPKSYFKCTHQKLYHCPAKKQVQRLDDDPYMFQVTYLGQHTCHLSSTAPSVPPPPSIQVRQDIIQQPTTTGIHPPPPSTSVPLSHWLSMRPSGEGTSGFGAGSMPMVGDFGVAAAGTGLSNLMSSSVVGSSSAAPGRYGDFQPVADLADAMFNSGSSSNNSMEVIFSSLDDKWDSGEKKN